MELFPGKTSTLTIENQKRPNLIIYKKDADTGEPVPNTVFTVRAADGHSIDEIKTDSTGKATLENLLPGVYEISEKSVPSAYLLDAPSQLVTLYPNRTHTVYFENHKKPSLIIQKVDSVTGDVIKGAEFSVWYGSNQTVTGELNDLGLYHTDENGLVELTGLRDGWYKVKEVEAAAGYQIKEPGEQSVYVKGGENKVVTFENVPLSAIVIWKFDSVTGQAVSGAKFVVKYLGGTSGTGGTVIGEYVTGPSGGVTITGLKMGTYVVEEISSDANHVVDTAPQTVVFNGKDQDVVQVSFGNTPKGAALIRKIDAVTHQPIAGVEFLVTDSKGALIGTNNGKFTTDASGCFTIDGLDPSATLVVKEVRAKDGYVLDETPQTVSVKPGQTVTLEFRNQPLGSLLIRKVCSVNPSVTLANAEFEVKYSDGAVVGNSNGIYRTDAKGEILITGLIPGKSVVVTETRAPDGFIKASQSQTVEIKEGAAVTLTFANQPKGSLIVQKRDSATGKPLSGAEFRITTAAGCEVGLDGVIGTSTLTQNGIFTTDAQGEIKITNLAPGAYVLNEVKAPDGYVMDAASTNVVIGTNGDTQTVIVKNSKAGSLLIEKRNSVTDKPLEGVTFKVTTSTGEFVPDENGVISSNGLYRTDANGQILINGVVGTLVVNEEKTIPGYVIDESTRSQTVVVNPNDTQKLTFYNIPKNTLTIQKYATDTKSPLAGVKFSVTESNGSVVGPNNGVYITDEGGQAVVQNLVPGETVIVREVETVAGYTLETVPQTVLVTEGEPLSVIFGNKPLANLTILKRDAKGSPLSNAQFLVTDQKGLPIGPSDGHYTTGFNGQVTVTGIQPDTAITVREEKAPAGYVLNTEPQTITVRSNEDNTLTFVNGQKGTLVVVKTDAETGKPLTGAEFKVTTAGGTLVADKEGAVSSNGIYTSGSDGSFTITGLEPGAYIITETKAPDGYALNPTPTTVEVTENDTQTIKIKNTPLNSLIIQKYEGDTTTPIPGVSFLVTDDNGAPIGTTEGEFVTDANGRIVVNGLTPGMSVTAREIKVPDDYVLDGTPKSVKITEGESQTLTFRNVRKGALIIEKKDKLTDAPLVGAEFQLTRDDGSYLDIGGHTNGIYTTDKNGEIRITGITGSITAKETRAVDGYVIDKETQTQTITVNPQETKTLTFYNEPLCSLTITKLDSVTGKPVANTEFTIKDANGEVFGRYTTGKDGTAVVTGLVPNSTVVVSESKVPDGYVLNTTPRTVTVKNGSGNSIVSNGNGLVFENDPKMTLTIHKYIEGTENEPLAGVGFKVTDGSGKEIGPTNGIYYTDKSGDIVIEGLEPGTTVIAREIKTVDGFVLDGTPQTIKIEAGKAQSMTFWNKRAGTLLIEKLDSVTKAPLAGAQFKVLYADGRVVDTEGGKLSSNGIYTTDQNGQIKITQVEGTLVVTEEKAPDGYVIDPNGKSQTVVVKPQETQTLMFENAPKTTLTIQKYIYGTNNEPLAGVEFLVTDSSGAVVGSGNGYFTTDKDGRIVVEGLEPGATITAKETRTAEGYVLDAAPQSIKIKAGEAQSMTFWNKEAGTLVIQKKDAVSGALIPGAQFQLTYAGGGYVDDNNGHLSSKGMYTTDENGEIRISGITGTVVAKETKPAAGYVMDQSTQTQTVTVNPQDTQTLVFLNEPLCSLTLTKVDSVTGKPVANTEFTVKDGNSNVLGRYTTGTDGTVIVTGLVPNSTVVVSESRVPDGYVLNTTPQTITVKNGANTLNSVPAGSSSVSAGTSGANGGNGLTFENDPKTTLTIHKYIEGTENEPLSGVGFKVTDGSGKEIGPTNGIYYTDKSGDIVIEGLEPGTTVIAREVKTVDGFVLDGTPQTIQIAAGKAQSLTFWNKRAGTLVIQKKDSVSGALISGAQFQLTYANGGYVDNDNGHLSSNGLYTTDAVGEIRISGVTGTIVAKEVKAAPGYVIDQSTQTQTVTVNPMDTQTLVFLNEPLCSLALTKVDSVTGKPLANTEFTVKDGNGNLLGRYTTGKDGTVVVTGLIPNSTVVVSESRVPDGYVLNTAPQTITVKNGANTLTSVPAGSSGGSSGTSGANGGNGLTFENDPKTTLVIEKYVEGTTTPLKGVTFLVTDGSGQAVGSSNGEYITDENGRIVIDGLEPGVTITAKEIKTLEGYVLDTSPKSIKIKTGEAQTLRFYNQKQGELVIRKLDKLTKQPLAGVEFELTYADGGYVDNANGHISSNGLYTTDAKGEIRISGITGTIVAKEVKTIPGYTIDPGTQTQTVTVNSADTQTLTFYNTPGTTLTIQKFVDGTTTPIQGVAFLVTDSSGAVLGPNGGEYVTDENGRIVINDLVPGVTITAKEIRTAEGYVLDSTPKSILIKEGEGQTMTFYNKSEGGLELIKVSESDKSKRIPNTTFEIRKKDGGLIDTVTTGKDGRVHVNLDAGDYYAVETEAAQGFKLDNTPQYFTVEDGKTTTLTVTNKAFSGILIHKTDSVTGKGIYGVTFLLFDSGNTPIGQYTSDNNGYVYIEDLTTTGRFYLRELENEGYVPDTQMKTVYVTAGETTLVEWKNIPITAQIQITKKSADYNPTNGLPAGTLLEGAVFEIYDKANNLVDTIKSDSRGLAVSRPLPLSRYTIREVKAPDNYGVSDTVLNAYLEHEGQIVSFEVTNKSLSTGVNITKTGPKEAMAGQPVRYQFTGITNRSNVRLDNFYWRDTLPAEVRLGTVVTGTYNFPGTYKITYRVNGGEPRTLADSLSTSQNYTLAASPVALGLASNERVTEIMFVFGQAPAGFAQVETPFIYCTAVSNLKSASFVNTADVGGTYNGVWVQGVSRWVTTVYGKSYPLPKTGY